MNDSQHSAFAEVFDMDEDIAARARDTGESAQSATDNLTGFEPMCQLCKGKQAQFSMPTGCEHMFCALCLRKMINGSSGVCICYVCFAEQTGGNPSASAGLSLSSSMASTPPSVEVHGKDYVFFSPTVDLRSGSVSVPARRERSSETGQTSHSLTHRYSEPNCAIPPQFDYRHKTSPTGVVVKLLNKSPQSFAVHSVTKDIYVCDFFTHTIHVISCYGQFIRSFGGAGSEPGMFQCPTCVRVTNEGIVVAESRNRRIQMFSFEGDYVRQVKGSGDHELKVPMGVAYDKNSVLYVCDETSVEVFSTEGRYVRTLSHPCMQRLRSACVANDYVYVSDRLAHTIFVFTTGGQFMRKFGTKGQEVGQLWEPLGLAVDSKGYVLVADSKNARVQVFNPLGEFYSQIRLRDEIRDLALLDDGAILIATNAGKIICY